MSSQMSWCLTIVHNKTYFGNDQFKNMTRFEWQLVVSRKKNIKTKQNKLIKGKCLQIASFQKTSQESTKHHFASISLTIIIFTTMITETRSSTVTRCKGKWNIAISHTESKTTKIGRDGNFHFLSLLCCYICSTYINK